MSDSNVYSVVDLYYSLWLKTDEHTILNYVRCMPADGLWFGKRFFANKEHQSCSYVLKAKIKSSPIIRLVHEQLPISQYAVDKWNLYSKLWKYLFLSLSDSCQNFFSEYVP